MRSGGRAIAGLSAEQGRVLEGQAILEDDIWSRIFRWKDSYICNGHGDGGRGSGMRQVEERREVQLRAEVLFWFCAE
jgi:hypothetical protein